MDVNVKQAVDAFNVVSSVKRAQKAFDFIAQYKADTGHRPSLSSIVMLWQDAEAALQAKIEEHEGI